MQNETLRPEATPTGLNDFSPTVDTTLRSHPEGVLVDKYNRRISYVPAADVKANYQIGARTGLGDPSYKLFNGQ